MEKQGSRNLPFSLKRTFRGSLARQIAASLRNAIETGYYRADDILPPVRDLARTLDVSKGVCEQAIALLRDEGLISPRPRVGSVVCHTGRPLWKGQILIVVPPGIGNPFDNTVYPIVRDMLTLNGYLPLTVTVPFGAKGTYDDFSLIDTQLRQHVDLVVQLFGAPEVTRWLARRKVDCVRLAFDDCRPGNCVGVIRRRDDIALPEFIEHCRVAKVKRVLQVTAMRAGPDVVPALKAMGISASNWRIPPPDGGRDALGLVQRAADEFAVRLARNGRKWLPDLLFFRDDHLTTGALVALMAAGVRIPEDVRLVTCSNRGLGPAFVKPLTRMEMDNVAIGKTLAEAVLSWLRTRTFPSGIEVGPAYVRGETF